MLAAEAPRAWFVKKMKEVLQRQGQIEPLQVHRPSNKVYRRDPHGDDILYAARELGWSTILVIFTDRWIEE